MAAPGVPTAAILAWEHQLLQRASTAPCPNLALQPETRATATALYDRMRKVLVPAEVRRDAVAMAEAKEVCHLLGVDEVVGVDGWGHAEEST